MHLPPHVPSLHSPPQWVPALQPSHLQRHTSAGPPFDAEIWQQQPGMRFSGVHLQPTPHLQSPQGQKHFGISDPPDAIFGFCKCKVNIKKMQEINQIFDLPQVELC